MIGGVVETTGMWSDVRRQTRISLKEFAPQFAAMCMS